MDNYASKQPTASKEKVILNEKGFLCDDKKYAKYEDPDSYLSIIRKYDFGGYNASFKISGNKTFGNPTNFELSCDPRDSENIAYCVHKIDNLIAALKSFKDGLQKAAKEN